MTPPDDFDPPTGVAEELEPGLRRIVAPNPSPMTYRGTNTYLLGKTQIAVIDPGPSSTEHLEAIQRAIAPHEKVTHIFVTHSHLDHSPLARTLSHATGAPIIAFGDSLAGQSDVMKELAAKGLTGGGEGVDTEFAPDQLIAHGESVETDDWSITAWHTPGHFGNHLSFEWNDALFCGDLVMGWASSLVSPPDGDLTDFMASCQALSDRSWRVFHAGHGAAIETPNARLDWLIEHRKMRECQILEALDRGPATPERLAKLIYEDTPLALLPAATRNVFAHLIDLHGKKMVLAEPELSAKATFTRTND